MGTMHLSKTKLFASPFWLRGYACFWMDSVSEFESPIRWGMLIRKADLVLHTESQYISFDTIGANDRATSVN